MTANPMNEEALDAQIASELKKWSELGLPPQTFEATLNQIHAETRSLLVITLLCEHLGLTKDEFQFQFKANLLEKFTEVRLEETPKLEEMRAKASMEKPENVLLGPDGKAVA